MLFSREKKNGAKQNKGPSVLGYMFNPRLGEDVKPVGEALSMFVFLLAAVFSSCGLFPKNHPAFLDKTGKIRLTMGEVLATGWNSFTFTRQDIPRAIMFFAVLGCVLFSLLFVVTYLLSIFLSKAHAADSMFAVPSGQFDWGLGWIDYLFKGINYTSPVALGTSVSSNPAWQVALGTALLFYSNAILVLAGLILFYYLVAMVAETAQYGVAMGKRANQLWAPIRLVVAIGLLVPISTVGSGVYGLNSGQYIVMQIARWGSGLATNVWEAFAKQLLISPGASDDFAACNPGSPSCITQADQVAGFADQMVENYACAYLTNYFFMEQGLYSDSIISSPLKFMDQLSYKVYTSIDNEPGEHLFGVNQVWIAGNAQLPHSKKICGGYIVPDLDQTSFYAPVKAAQVEIVSSYLPKFQEIAEKYAGCFARPEDPDLCKEEAKKGHLNKEVNDLNKELKQKIAEKVKILIALKDKEVADLLKESLKATGGWMGAGAYFNTIARISAERAASKRDVVPVSIQPDIWNPYRNERESDWLDKVVLKRDMKSVSTAEDAVRQSLGSLNRIMKAGPAKGEVKDSTTGLLTPIDLAAQKETDVAIPKLIKGNLSVLEAKSLLQGGVMSFFFTSLRYALEAAGIWTTDGKDGYLAIRFDDKRNVWSEVIAFGQNVMEAGGYMFNIAASLYLLSLVKDGFASFGSLFFTAGSALLVAGASLAFILPLHPFFRFFFGAIIWIMNVCEAVVAVPLWALAHVNPSGDGLPGDKAMKGYYMIFHILIRPSLMVLGLIVSYLLFNISVSFVNSIFIIAAKGSDMKAQGSFNYFPELIYSIMYCILIYTCGNVCFKTIGFFPQKSLDWLGSSNREEPIQDRSVSGVLAGTIGTYLGGKAFESAVHGGVGLLKNNAGGGGGGGGGKGKGKGKGRDDNGESNNNNLSNNSSQIASVSHAQDEKASQSSVAELSEKDKVNYQKDNDSGLYLDKGKMERDEKKSKGAAGLDRSKDKEATKKADEKAAQRSSDYLNDHRTQFLKELNPQNFFPDD